MIITKEIVDFIRPDHCRTSCSDDDLANSWGGEIECGEIVFPRCDRCYFLSHVGEDSTELDFQIDYLTLVYSGK
jgi:hypothetical protein